MHWLKRGESFLLKRRPGKKVSNYTNLPDLKLQTEGKGWGWGAPPASVDMGSPLYVEGTGQPKPNVDLSQCRPSLPILKYHNASTRPGAGLLVPDPSNTGKIMPDGSRSRRKCWGGVLRW